jgi:signal transduction histidine kinase
MATAGSAAGLAVVSDDGAVPSAETPTPSRWPVARPVLQFGLAGLVAVLVVGVATGVASRRVGQREAITDARTTTLIKAQTVVEPVVANGLPSAEPAAVAAIDRVVRAGVLDKSLVRVKIWTRDGDIVYSDESRLKGTSYRLGAEEVAAIDHGVIKAEVSDLGKPENRYERPFRKLLEVYLPIRTPSGSRLLFEAYYRYDAVSASGARIWRSFAPVSIGALVALELVQVPVAWSLARRLRQRQRERERLLTRALEASDTERRRIAGDLHDGVVQDLAGVALSLAGSSRASTLPPQTATLLERSATQVRDSIKALRSLLVDIYPPKLTETGLASALADLLAGMPARGLTASLHTEELVEPLPEDVAKLLWRSAQESIRNVITHAKANAVDVTLATRLDLATLDVVDDGVGFETHELAAKAAGGHIGLRGLSDLVTAAGGRLVVDAQPGAGTRVHVEVPVQ